jgi:Fe-S oxidoreductase
MGVKILNTHLDCCGVPFLSCGNVEQFIKQAEYNLSQIPDEFDYFLTDCASCQNAFSEYENYIEDEKLLDKLKKINEKSVNVVDFVVKNVKSFEFEQKTSFTFHKPCHLEDMNFLQEFLKKAKNVEYIEMEEYDKCCGFSGEFAVKNPEISTQISAKKSKNALETKADYILTFCPACLLGLSQGLIEAKCKSSTSQSFNFSTNLSPYHPITLSPFMEFISNSKIVV